MMRRFQLNCSKLLFCVQRCINFWQSLVWLLKLRSAHNVIIFFQDPFIFVKRQFVGKVQKLLKERHLPQKYACALALSIGVTDDDFLAEVREHWQTIFTSISKNHHEIDEDIPGSCFSFNQLVVTTCRPSSSFVISLNCHAAKHDSESLLGLDHLMHPIFQNMCSSSSSIYLHKKLNSPK